MLPSPKTTNADFDAAWNYDDPAGTEAAFRAMLPTIDEPAARAELLTQIARALGLQRRFDDAHATLDQVERLLADANPRLSVRYLLERGRAFNSSGQRDKAKPLFAQAAAMRGVAPDAFVVDALHMCAIVEPGADEQLALNLRALELAEHSPDPGARKWLASLYNNIGWTQYERKRYDDALAVFEKAVELRAARGEPNGLRIAHYCVAKTYRAMGRLDEALAIQQRLFREADGERDGYVSEEIAECLLAKGDVDASRPHFARAHELLSQDAWLVEKEPARIARLASLGA